MRQDAKRATHEFQSTHNLAKTPLKAAQAPDAMASTIHLFCCIQPILSSFGGTRMFASLLSESDGDGDGSRRDSSLEFIFASRWPLAVRDAGVDGVGCAVSDSRELLCAMFVGLLGSGG